MSPFDSGTRGSTGSHGHVSIRELETTAAVEVAKNAMNMVKDTSNISLIVRDTTKYETTPGRNLQKPLSNERTSNLSEQPNTEKLRSTYANLINLMPKDFRDSFQAMLTLPKDQQLKNFTLLDSSLQTTAKFVAFLSNAPSVVLADSPMALRATSNVLLPYLSLSSVVRDNKSILGGVQSYLETTGPNNPHFDAISGFLGKFAPLADDLENGLNQLREPGSEKTGRALLAKTADKLSNLEEQFSRLYSGSQLQLLGPTLHTAKITAQALSLEQPGSAALFISLSMATTGIKESESSLGLLGKNISTLLDAFTSGAQKIAGSSLSNAGAALLSNLATVGLMGATLLGSLAYEAGTSAKDETPKATSEKNFVYNLLIQTLSGSGTFSGISNALLSAADVKDPATSPLSSLLTTGLLLSMISVTSKGQDLSSTEPVLQAQNDSLKDLINSASETVSEGLNSGKLTGNNAENLNVYLQQASIALEKDDTEGVQSALSSSLELTEATTGNYIKDVGDQKNLAQSLQSGLSAGANEINSTITSISVAA